MIGKLVQSVLPEVTGLIDQLHTSGEEKSEAKLKLQRLKEMIQIDMPAEFWMAWSGVVSIWSIGRSAERRGAQNKAINVITGGK